MMVLAENKKTQNIQLQDDVYTQQSPTKTVMRAKKCFKFILITKFSDFIRIKLAWISFLTE